MGCDGKAISAEARCRFRCPRWGFPPAMYTAEHLVDEDAVHLETEERGF